MSFFDKFFGKKEDGEPHVSPPQPARAPQVSRDGGVSVYPPGASIAGRYEVASRPLMGGMGIVYLCFDHQDQRPVALKTFKPEFLPDRAARDRFLREGTTWVELGSHPHVVRCYGVEHVGDGREVYLVLELVAKAEGRADASLRSWLVPGRPLPAAQALLFALQIARGMIHATAAVPGLVHRDLKPENLLVGADTLAGVSVNQLRITDFGLVRALGEGDVVSAVGEGERLAGRPGLTRVGAVLGTPPYMAPEQWGGPDVDARADIYALGCILGEMVTGQMLVQEKTLHGFKQAHQGGRATQAVKALPGSLVGLLDRCLAAKPGARYGSWTEIETALATAYKAVVGQAAPGPESAAVVDRTERVAAGWSYSALGLSYLDIGKAEVAQNYFERARAAGVVEVEQRLEATGLNHLGMTHERLGEAQRAVSYYRQALAIFCEISYRQGEGQALGNLGNAYGKLGDTHRAISYYEQSLIIHRELGDLEGEGLDLMNLGVAYTELGDAKRAISCSEQALAIARESGNRRKEGQALDALGAAWLCKGDARRAIDCSEQALDIYREIGDRHRESYALETLGSAYINLGTPKRAVGYYEQALTIDRELGNLHGAGIILGNLGTACDNLGDVRRAVGYYEQASAIFEENGDVKSDALNRFNLAVLLFRQRRFAEALPHAQRAAQVLTQSGHTQYAEQAKQLVTQIRAALR